MSPVYLFHQPRMFRFNGVGFGGLGYDAPTPPRGPVVVSSGFILSLAKYSVFPHFIIARVTLYVSIHYFSNLCSVWRIRTYPSPQISFQLFVYSPFLPVSAATQFSKTMITQLLSCLLFIPLGPAPFYYHSSGTDKQLLGGCLTIY